MPYSFGGYKTETVNCVDNQDSYIYIYYYTSLHGGTYTDTRRTIAYARPSDTATARNSLRYSPYPLSKFQKGTRASPIVRNGIMAAPFCVSSKLGSINGKSA